MGLAQKYGKDFLKNLREQSEKTYQSVSALNWGETINNSFVIPNRYYFLWKKNDSDRRMININCDIKDYILQFINKEKSEVSIYIGVDSQNKLLKTEFVVALILYVNKNGGHEIISRINLSKMYDYRYKLLREADMLGEVARNLCPFLKNNNIEFELHLDYNNKTNHKSNGVVTEAKSYFKFLGYEFKIKPEAFAASKSADFFCK